MVDVVTDASVLDVVDVLDVVGTGSPAWRQRSRSSVAVVVQTIASPVDVTPVAPWVEQNAPGVTVVCPSACPPMTTTPAIVTNARTTRLIRI